MSYTQDELKQEAQQEYVRNVEVAWNLALKEKDVELMDNIIADLQENGMNEVAERYEAIKDELADREIDE